MSVRETDDPARYFREVWLGAKGFARWPVDARFGMWALAFALWFPSFVVLVGIVPVLALALLAGWLFLRWVRRVHSDRSRFALVTLIALGLLLVSFKPSVSFWLLPMHWILAAILAPALAVYTTSRIAPYVDRNVPLSYRVGLLFAAAGRPRRTRPERQYDVHDELLVVADGLRLDDFRKLSLVKENH